VDRQGVVVFYTIHAVFRLEKALKGKGMLTKPIPTPRHLSSDCGTALRFPWSRRAVVEAAIDELQIEIDGIHELPK
jgi:hypothetical protein